MHPGSEPTGGGAGVPEEGNAGMEAVPVPAMHLLHSLRAAHYARECESRVHLCALIAAHHARTGIVPVAWRRTEAAQSAGSEADVSGMRDAITANYAATGAQGRTVRTRRLDGG